MKTARITVRLYEKRSSLVHLQARLRKLTFGALGRMWGIFKSAYTRVKTLIAWSCGEIVGWAIVSTQGIQLYVRSSFRRMGIGSRLMKRALALRSQVHVYNWNRQANSFFATFNANMTLEFGYVRGGKRVRKKK